MIAQWIFLATNFEGFRTPTVHDRRAPGGATGAVRWNGATAAPL